MLHEPVQVYADKVTDLKPIHERLPVELGTSDAAVPSMVILPTVIGKQSKLIPDHFSGGRVWHRLEIITKLFFETHRRSVSSIEIDKDEPLRRDVGMDLEKRMGLGIKVREASILSGFVQFASREIRPCRAVSILWATGLGSFMLTSHEIDMQVPCWTRNSFVSLDAPGVDKYCGTH